MGRDQKDRYYTPTWCITGLVKRLDDVLPPLMKESLAFDVVVDIGAGDGRIGFAVAEWLKEQKPEVYLIEPSAPVDLMEVAKEHGVDRVTVYGEDYQQIADRRDVAWKDKRVLFVSNPPFSQSTEFVQKTLWQLDDVCGVGSWAFFLLRMDWRASKERAGGLMESRPLTLEFPLSPRPSFCEGASGSKTDFYNYAWHGWSRGGPRVRWSWPIIRAGR